MRADHELAIEAILGVRKHIRVGLLGEVEGWKPSSKTGGHAEVEEVKVKRMAQENGVIRTQGALG